MMNEEMKKTVMEVGLELYNQTEIKKLKPSFYQLVKVLDGRISRNTISTVLDILCDIGLADLPAKTGFQYVLTTEGEYFFGKVYKRVILT